MVATTTTTGGGAGQVGVGEGKNNLVHSIKLSTVGPGRMSGQDIIYEPSDMDLAMKLHYLRVVYYFRSQAFDGLTVFKIKEPTFTWFSHYFFTCGRFRRADSGRSYIKCNDCGARFVEAHCDLTLDDWLSSHHPSPLDMLLVPNQVIGPELQFSPLVLLQLTRFKCGGVSMGISWAHVLGDAFSVAEFMNVMGTISSGNHPSPPLDPARSRIVPKNFTPTADDQPIKDPISVRRVGPLGDHWIVANNCKMATISLHVAATQLANLRSAIASDESDSSFECLCALIWQSVAKVRGGSEPRIVTVCRKGRTGHEDEGIFTGNGLAVSVVEANFAVGEAKPRELVDLILAGKRTEDERRKIEDAMGKENGVPDFVFYGANLTFLDLGSANFYDMEIRGQKPVSVNYMIDGVGDEGLVVVVPAPPAEGKENGGVGGGRIVNVTLPESHVMGLKSELKSAWSIA